MKCFSPVNIRDPVEPESKRYIAVPCNKCVACLSNRRKMWIIRITQEVKVSKGCYFVTLTYSDENLRFGEVRPTLYKKDVQDFIKRFRKNTKLKIRYFAVGEYGEKTLRPHYHLIMFNLGLDKIEAKKQIEKAWRNMGHSHVGDVTPKSISYTAKYMLNNFTSDFSGHQKPFMICSKGIGASYIEKRLEWHKNDLKRQYVVLDGGNKQVLPRYYSDKMFTKREKNLIKKMNEDYNRSIETDMERYAEDVRLEVSRKSHITEREQRKIKSKSKF